MPAVSLSSSVLHLPFLLSAQSYRRFIGIEGAEATSAPGGGALLRGAITAFATEAELIGDIEESAEESGAIVIGEINQASFLDKTTELDEMACARASILYPLPRIGAGAIAIEAVA